MPAAARWIYPVEALCIVFGTIGRVKDDDDFGWLGITFTNDANGLMLADRCLVGMRVKHHYLTTGHSLAWGQGA